MPGSLLRNTLDAFDNMLTKPEAIALVDSFARSVIASYRVVNEQSQRSGRNVLEQEGRITRQLLTALTGETEWTDEELRSLS